MKKFSRRFDGWWVGLLCLVQVLAALGFSYVFVSREFCFHWADTSHVWVGTMYLRDLLHESGLLAAVRWAIYTIRHYDYNSAGALLLLPAAEAFGLSRIAFIVSLTGILALPGTLILSAAVMTAARKSWPNLRITWFALPLFIVLTMPLFWECVLFGYADVGACLFMATALWIYFRNNLGEQRFPGLLSLALSLALLVMYRKYFSAWVVAFFFAAGLDILFYSLVPEWRAAPERFLRGNSAARRAIVNYLLVGVMTGVIFLALAWPLAVTMIGANYREALSYFNKNQPLYMEFVGIGKRLGLPLAVVVMAGSITLLVDRKTRRYGLFFLLLGWATFGVFRLQIPLQPNHMYLIIPPLVGLASLALLQAFAKFGRKAGFGLASTAGILLSLIGLVCSFLPETKPVAARFGCLISSVREYPVVRRDAAQVTQLLDRLAGLSTGAMDRVYVVGASADYSANLLKNARYTLKRKTTFEYHLVFSHGVDLWHGFPSNLLEARYVVLFDPLQLLSEVRYHRVMELPWHSLMEQRDIGPAYRRLPGEIVFERAKAVIFERVRPLKKSEIDELADRLRQYYPDRPKVFTYRPPYDMADDT